MEEDEDGSKDKWKTEKGKKENLRMKNTEEQRIRA
jgi:hypothetical protein